MVGSIRLGADISIKAMAESSLRACMHEIFGLTHVPFEIQVHGSIPDLIYRLNLVHQWSLKIVVVAEQDYHDEIREAAQNYPFAGKLVLLTPKEVEKAKKDFTELRDLRKKIFI